MQGAILVIAVLHLSAARFLRSARGEYSYNYGTSGEVRLMSPVESTRAHPWGRVQVNHNGAWGTACQDALDENTLKVICNEMGADGGYRIGESEFPAGNDDTLYGPVTLGNPQCSGQESSLLQCQHEGLGNADCRHYADILVQCYTAGDEQEERLRLVDSEGNSGGSSGRLEVLHNGVWGTVCNSYSYLTPHFLCAKLGYNSGTIMPHLEVPPISDINSPIWAVGLSCIEPIDKVIDCMYGNTHGYGVLVHGNCWAHSNDLGLVCEGNQAQDGELQQAESGSLTVFHQDIWWQICSHQFGYADAGVACRQMGHSGSVEAILPMSYDSAPASVWLTDFECSGDEERLIDCPSTPQAVSCSGGPVAIRCGSVPDREPGREGEIQLIDGTDGLQGRVEIFHDGVWGTICKGGMDEPEVKVICRELGHDSGRVNHAYWETYGGRLETPIHLDNVNCTGAEKAITDCRHGPWGQHSCERDQVVWVECTDDDSEESAHDDVSDYRRHLPDGAFSVGGKRRSIFNRAQK